MLVMMMMAMMMMAISVGGVRWRDRLIPRDEKSCSERRFENGFYTTTTRFYFDLLNNYYPCGGRGAQFTIQLLRFSYREQHPKCVLSEKWIASILQAGDKKQIYEKFKVKFNFWKSVAMKS